MPRVTTRSVSGLPVVILVAYAHRHALMSRLALLKGHGYDAVAAQTGSQAMDVAQRFDVNGAIVGLPLPDADANRLVVDLRTQRPTCQLILMADSPPIRSVVEAMRAGAYDYLSNPVGDDHLLDVVTRAIGGMRSKPIVIGSVAQLMPDSWIRRPAATDDCGVVHVRRAIAFMLRHFHDSTIQMRTIAAGAGVSRDYLSHLMHRCTSKGAIDVLHEIRVAHAAWLLESTTLSIKEVVSRCGYHTYGELGSHFRRLAGVLPTEWRRAAASTRPHLEGNSLDRQRFYEQRWASGATITSRHCGGHVEGE